MFGEGVSNSSLIVVELSSAKGQRERLILKRIHKRGDPLQGRTRTLRIASPQFQGTVTELAKRVVRSLILGDSRSLTELRRDKLTFENPY